MTLMKHGFQSEILRTVNSKGSLNFVHLAKNYGMLQYTVYNSVFRHYYSPGEAVTNTVCGLDQFLFHLDTKFVIMPD